MSVERRAVAWLEDLFLFLSPLDSSVQDSVVSRRQICWQVIQHLSQLGWLDQRPHDNKAVSASMTETMPRSQRDLSRAASDQGKTVLLFIHSVRQGSRIEPHDSISCGIIVKAMSTFIIRDERGRKRECYFRVVYICMNRTHRYNRYKLSVTLLAICDFSRFLIRVDT